MKTYERSLGSTEKAARKLGFGDNDVRESLGSLLTATGSYQKSLKELGTAQDVARFKHIDLTAATKLLISAQSGSQRASKALGLAILPVTSHADALKTAYKALTKEQQKATAETYKQQLAHAKLQDKLATGESVLAAVTAKTKGFSEAYGKTAAGQIERFRSEFEHLKAELGKGLLPILTAGTSKLTGFVTTIETHIPEIRAQFGGLAGVIGSAGKALLGFGGSRVGQSALAGLATTFVGSGLVGEVHSFVDLLKTMNPVLIGAGFAAGVLGSALFAIITSTSGLTREMIAAKQAIDGVKDAMNNSVQAGQNLRVAKHQQTADEIAHKEAIKGTAKALHDYGKDSSQYRAALANEHLLADRVVQDGINLKNAHQGVRQAAVSVADASRKQAAALDAVQARAGRLWHQYDQLSGRGAAFAAAARDGSRAASQFATPQQAAAASQYARAVYKLVGAMGGTKREAQTARDAVIGLASALGRLPTRKEVSIFVRTFTRGPGGTGPHAAGGVVAGPPSNLMGQDTVLGTLIPGEVVVNPARPERGLRALRDAGIEGFARGGKVKHRAPRLPKWIDLAEARARGTSTLTDDVSALMADERWTNQQLGRGDLTASERRTLQKRRISNRQKLARLHTRQANRAQKDYSQLPDRIQKRIAKARYENDNAALLRALKDGKAWLLQQLRRRGLSNGQQAAIYQALDAIDGEIDAVAGDTSGQSTEDLQAQLDQSRSQTAAATRRAELDEAYGATGAYAGAGRGGGGGGDTYVFQSLLTDLDTVRRASGMVARGFGMQGFRPATRVRLGI